MMPECGCPMCDECARDSLINSDKNECPDCGEANNSPDDLIPWRQLRDKVSYSTLYLEWTLQLWLLHMSYSDAILIDSL